ncbi:hypothetical protein, partial [Klebsiella pneumoniae]|uniref:hypothetical protein n=1 Tax=Klebsiella pneumoniae TaxID=573 RepID=UPI003FD2BCA5
MDAQLATLAYSLLSLSEKLLLLLGATAFFGAAIKRAVFVGLVAACALYLLAVQLMLWPAWLSGLALGLVNSLTLVA